MFEIVLSVLAILLILGLTRAGMVFGVFYELTSAVLLFFAMMIALRYWYLATRLVAAWIPSARSYAPFVAYWALFLIGCLPLIVVLNHLTTESVPRYPRVVDRLLGLVFGFVSGTIFTCCVMTSLVTLLMNVWPSYNPRALWLPFDRFPIAVYQKIERDWARVTETEPGHTLFPSVEKNSGGEPQLSWQ
jgi:uncharacterized membrane protein required for colicin V production